VSAPLSGGRGVADNPLELDRRSGSLLRAGRYGVVVSTTSTVVLLALVVAAFFLAPGSGTVRDRFFSPHHFRASIGPVWDGFLVNLKLMLIAEVLVLVLALVIAVVRGLPGAVAFPLRMLAIFYTDLFRGIPLILVVYIVGYAIPGLQLHVVSTQSVFTYGVIALVLVYSAYVTEVYRAGIESVHGSQTAAARSLGLSHWQTLLHVVLPQAVRRVVPPLLNDFIGLQKDTALVSLLGVVESARVAQDYGAQNFNFTGYSVAALLFVLLTIPLARFTDYLIRRDQRRMRAAGG
jgi:polar amino acid transport system permease protein